jgi:5-formyltetrahydrofolate cyclo-ligase
MPEQDRLFSEHRAQEICLGLPEFLSAGSVALYAPVHNEVETSLLLIESLAAGKVVLFPAVTHEGVEFRRITALDDFAPGRFGIWEPKNVCAVYDPTKIDFFIIPGVAFDLSCRRVGYGKGYYDRALHKLEKSGRLAGFCYDFQLVDEIPAAPHDVEMDMVITDRRVVRSSGQFT